MKLRDNYVLSTAEISSLKDELTAWKNELTACQNELTACQNELTACKNESKQLELQVTRLQDELKSQSEAPSNQVAVAITTTRKVCVDIQHPRHAHL